MVMVVLESTPFQDLVEITALDSAFSETKVAQRLRTKLNSMIDNVDTLVSQLEEEKRMLEETIVDPAMPNSGAVRRCLMISSASAF